MARNDQEMEQQSMAHWRKASTRNKDCSKWTMASDNTAMKGKGHKRHTIAFG
jgi:hypothetical protein